MGLVSSLWAFFVEFWYWFVACWVIGGYIYWKRHNEYPVMKYGRRELCKDYTERIKTNLTAVFTITQGKVRYDTPEMVKTEPLMNVLFQHTLPKESLFECDEYYKIQSGMFDIKDLYNEIKAKEMLKGVEMPEIKEGAVIFTEDHPTGIIASYLSFSDDGKIYTLKVSW